jgi:hypothetical protein
MSVFAAQAFAEKGKFRQKKLADFGGKTMVSHIN